MYEKPSTSSPTRDTTATDRQCSSRYGTALTIIVRCVREAGHRGLHQSSPITAPTAYCWYDEHALRRAAEEG